MSTATFSDPTTHAAPDTHTDVVNPQVESDVTMSVPELPEEVVEELKHEDEAAAWNLGRILVATFVYTVLTGLLAIAWTQFVGDITPAAFATVVGVPAVVLVLVSVTVGWMRAISETNETLD